MIPGTLAVLALLVASMAMSATASHSPDFYVSPTGSDAWSGTLAEPVVGRTDGPFATLERARDAVRQLKRSKSTDIAVLVRGGTYQLDKTVVFGLEDSGEGTQTISYEAYPGETPVFSSGRTIKGWKKVTGTLPGLPKAAQGHVLEAEVTGRFFTLYDKKAQSEGIDVHSLAVDPMFVDPANGDFRLKPDSPALKLGFVPFDMSKVGLRN